MLIRATEKRIRNFFALLVILYISAGIPLIHSVLHESFSHHDHHCFDRGVDHLQSILEESEHHNCPICDFLAANRMYISKAAPPIEIMGVVQKIVAEIYAENLKSFPDQNEPRAPPSA